MSVISQFGVVSGLFSYTYLIGISHIERNKFSAYICIFISRLHLGMCGRLGQCYTPLSLLAHPPPKNKKHEKHGYNR